jgi:hypothetical protein
VLTGDTNMNRVATTFQVLPEQNSGAPSTLSTFLQWGASVAPAQNYALLLWNHGAGIYGSNYDDSDGVASDHLTISEVAAAIGAAGVPRLSLVGYDACLMGMIEIGHSFKNRTDVFVGSEENVLATGYDYTTLFNILKTTPEAVTAQQLGAGFVNSFAGTYVPGGAPDDTNSAIRTTGYSGLETALKAFTNSTIGATTTTRNRLGRARDMAIQYDGSGFVDFRDLGSFMTNVSGDNTIPASIRAAATEVITAINAAVIAKTNDSRGSSGISIYLPNFTYDSTYTTMFPAFESATGWGTFVRWLVTGVQSVAGSGAAASPTGGKGGVRIASDHFNPYISTYGLLDADKPPIRRSPASELIGGKEVYRPNRRDVDSLARIGEARHQDQTSDSILRDGLEDDWLASLPGIQVDKFDS